MHAFSQSWRTTHLRCTALQSKACIVDVGKQIVLGELYFNMYYFDLFCFANLRASTGVKCEKRGIAHCEPLDTRAKIHHHQLIHHWWTITKHQFCHHHQPSVEPRLLVCLEICLVYSELDPWWNMAIVAIMPPFMIGFAWLFTAINPSHGPNNDYNGSLLVIN